MFHLAKRIKNTGIVEKHFEGCFERLLNWNGENRKDIKKDLKAFVAKQETASLKHALQHSKHAWMLQLWPDMKAKRPWEMKGVSPHHQRFWTKFALCGHH